MKKYLIFWIQAMIWLYVTMCILTWAITLPLTPYMLISMGWVSGSILVELYIIEKGNK